MVLIGGFVDIVLEGIIGFYVGKVFNVDCEVVYLDDVKLLVVIVKRVVKSYGVFELKRMIRNCMS